MEVNGCVVVERITSRHEGVNLSIIPRGRNALIAELTMSLNGQVIDGVVRSAGKHLRGKEHDTK